MTHRFGRFIIQDAISLADLSVIYDNATPWLIEAHPYEMASTVYASSDLFDAISEGEDIPEYAVRVSFDEVKGSLGAEFSRIA